MVYLSHSYNLLKPFDEFICHVARTLVGFSEPRAGDITAYKGPSSGQRINEAISVVTLNGCA